MGTAPVMVSGRFLVLLIVGCAAAQSAPSEAIGVRYDNHMRELCKSKSSRRRSVHQDFRCDNYILPPGNVLGMFDLCNASSLKSVSHGPSMGAAYTGKAVCSKCRELLSEALGSLIPQADWSSSITSYEKMLRVCQTHAKKCPNTKHCEDSQKIRHNMLEYSQGESRVGDDGKGLLLAKVTYGYADSPRWGEAPRGASKKTCDTDCSKCGYTVGTLGSDSCPSSSSAFTTKQQCEAAASSFGVAFGKEDSWSNYPKGCMCVTTPSKCYFNTHAGASKSDVKVLCGRRNKRWRNKPTSCKPGGTSHWTHMFGMKVIRCNSTESPSHCEVHKKCITGAVESLTKSDASTGKAWAVWRAGATIPAELKQNILYHKHNPVPESISSFSQGSCKIL